MEPTAKDGFFSSLFDLSFTHFVTAKVIKVLFVLLLVLLALVYLGVGISALAGGSAGFGVLWFVLVGPLVTLVYILLYRVFFEILIVIFRIYENTNEQVELMRRAAPSPVSPPAPPAPGGSSSGA